MAPVTDRAVSGSARTRWRSTLAIGALLIGVLAMHVLSGHVHSAVEHGGSSTAGSHPAGHDSLADRPSDRGSGLESTLGCDVGTVCLFLVGIGLTLALNGRAGRPLVGRRVDDPTSQLAILSRRARLPEPPDLHTLSILRC